MLTSCATVPLGEVPANGKGRVEHPDMKEGSGLIESDFRPGAFWALNDSGHPPDLFLMDAQGRHLAKVRVAGAENRDWETVTTDGTGGIWIGDVGNNQNTRRDLTVYRIQEPPADAELPETLSVVRSLQIRYPDQTEFPPAVHNFDCEAMFVWRESLYFLTKHRADSDTKLYSLDLETAASENVLTLEERAKGVGAVTGCDLHPDGRRLAVLTYGGVWVFTRSEEDLFFSEAPQVYRWRPWSMLQVEGIAWSGEDELLITNEQRSIFRVSLADFRTVANW